MIELSCCPVCKSSKIYIYAKKQCFFDKYFSSPESIVSNIILRDIIKKDSVEINTMRCKNCGHLFLSPTFSPYEIRTIYSHESKEKREELKKIYESKTKKTWGQTVGGNNWLENKKENLSKRPQIIKNIIDKYATCNKNKILDIGGASGHNLVGFKNEAQLFIMDLLESKEMNENITYLRDYDSASNFGPFDIIISTHTFEHIVDLDQEMKNIIKIIKQGSHLYIEVPCESFSIIKRKIAQGLRPHINFFTRNSLENLFLLNGFKTKFLSLHLMPYGELRMYTYVGLFEYVDRRSRRLNRNHLYNFVKDGLLIAKNKYFNKDRKITYEVN
jgi:SAM-dependent methyltransferase